MSFNRIKYDNCSYRTDLGQQVSQLSYLLDSSKYEHCNKCRHELGWVGGTNVSHIKGNLVDLESDLFSIDRPLTRCPKYDYQPRTDGKVQGISQYKTTCYPEIDTNKLHLKPCQAVKYTNIPGPPPLDYWSCADLEKQN
jgi:hypothetical protein